MSAPTDYQQLRDRRIKQLSDRGVRKGLLATTCRRLDGSVMPLSDYLRWSRDELVNAIIQSEFPPAPTPLEEDEEDDGPACGWLKEPGTAGAGCLLPAGHCGSCDPVGDAR